MGPALLLDVDDARAGRTCRTLDIAFPVMPVLRLRNGVELRYAVATRQPTLAIVGQVPAPFFARTLAWEIKALRPSTPVIALAHDDVDAACWRAAGSSVIVIVDGEGAERQLLLSVDRLLHGDGPHPRGERAPRAGQVHLDSHRLKNRVAGLLAGMHAFAAELRATAHDAAQVRRVTQEYVDRLVDVVADISAMVAASESLTASEHE